MRVLPKDALIPWDHLTLRSKVGTKSSMTVLAIVNCEVTPVFSTMIRLTSWNDLCFLQSVRCESDGVKTKQLTSKDRSNSLNHLRLSDFMRKFCWWLVSIVEFTSQNMLIWEADQARSMSQPGKQAKENKIKRQLHDCTLQSTRDSNSVG